MSRRANFCANVCPVCSRAKKGNKVCQAIAGVDRKFCPMCKAYEKETGKRADGR